MQVKLIKLRRYHGYSQKQMAEFLKIDLRTYINKESGRSQFKLNEMFIIAKLFKEELDNIFLPTDFMNHEAREGNLKEC